MFQEVNVSEVEIGKAVVPNECSSLGENNPLRLIDCSIFKLNKGMCCLLTISTNDTDKIDRTACIVLEKFDAGIINSTSRKYKEMGIGDALIECKNFYIYYSYILILFILFIL